MKTFCRDPLYKAMMIIYIKNKNAMPAIAQIITNAGHGYIQICFSFCARRFTVW